LPPETDALLADLDRRLIVATQGGLPLVERPYELLGRELDLSGEQVQQRLAAMLADGRIRRIGAVPNHYAIGYTANGMSVWDVADEHIDELGAQVGALSFVSHCYRRPRRLPLWPYNLFAMVHGASREEVAADVAQIAKLLGAACRQHDILYSSRILKKTGLRLAG
jgi:DNA-binding Lrp family transcriptional regulator